MHNESLSNYLWTNVCSEVKNKKYDHYLLTESLWQWGVLYIICVFSIVSIFSCSLCESVTVVAGLWIHSTSGVKCVISGVIRFISGLYSGNSGNSVEAFWVSGPAEQSRGSSSIVWQGGFKIPLFSLWTSFSVNKAAFDSRKVLTGISSCDVLVLHKQEVFQFFDGSQSDSDPCVAWLLELLLVRSCWISGRASTRSFSGSSWNL